MADSKLTALTELSVVALDDITYVVDDVAGTPTSVKLSLNRLGGLFLPGLCGGRLTTESGVPVSTSDRTSQGTLYLTPFAHNRVALYDGTRWKLYTFAEVSLSLTLTSGKNYDVFLYDNSGSLTLELSAAWTNDTTRADALTTQDGVPVKSGATTRLHVGTIRASGTNVTEDSEGGTTSQVGGKRYVWSRYNQVPRALAVKDTTDSWTYASSTYRQWNNTAGNKVEYVVGDASAWVEAHFVAGIYNVTSGNPGIGVDSTSTNSAKVFGEMSGGSIVIPVPALYRGRPGLGYHYLAPLERANSGTATFMGDDTGWEQSGLYATVWG